MSGAKIARSVKSVVSLKRFSPIRANIYGNSGDYGGTEFSYNLDFSDGALSSGTGFDVLFSDLPEKMVAMWFYRRDDPITGEADDRMIMMSESGYFYDRRFSDGSFSLIHDLSFSSAPSGVCYNYNGDDVIIFAGSGEGLKIYDGEQVTFVADAPPINSVCMHYERLFATTDGGKTLWFSDDFDPTNWSVSLSEAGFIDMSGYRGEALKTLSFLDYLYVFRTYGITRVSAYGDQTSFAVSDLFVSSGKIHKNSVTYCGDRIIFMADDGFYAFNGLTATKILSGLDGVVNYEKEGVGGQYYNGKAYFGVKAVYDGDTYDCVLVYDVLNGYYHLLHGLFPRDVCTVYGREDYALCFLSEDGNTVYEIGESGMIGSDSVKKMWQSKFCDFGITKPNKVLRSVSLYSKSDLIIEISNGEHTASYTVYGGKGRKTVKTNMRGDNFQITVLTDEKDVKVSAITLTFEYYS